MSLGTDPRADPRIVEFFKAFKMDGPAADLPIPYPCHDWKTLYNTFMEMEKGFTGMFDAVVQGLPPVSGIEESVVQITGIDGNLIDLYICKPRGLASDAPCVVHIHGGGFAMMRPNNGAYTRHRQNLASRGLVVVSVDYRLSGGENPAPFPAALHDCTSAVSWVYANKQALHVSKIILHGESAGGGLSLSTALKLKQTGKLHEVAGVFACCPYVSNLYHLPKGASEELPSLNECDGYIMTHNMCALMASLYCKLDEKQEKSPLAWPYHATVDDLRGLPPICITVDELDPLRDEGLALARKLRQAEVQGTTSVLAGLPHGAEVMCVKAVPEVVGSLDDSIASFCRRL